MNTKIAVIDIGSNSVRLQVTEFDSKKFRVLLEEKDNIRLGEDAFEKGVFSPEKVLILVETLKRYRKIINSLNINTVRAVATAGFREISNQAETLDRIFQETGITVEIISGTEEARLIFMGVVANYDLQHKKALLVDIGGGSCELIIGQADNIDDIKSLRLGCIRLTRHFLKSNPVKPEEIRLVNQEIDSVFNKIRESLNKHPFDIVIGTGGSLNNIRDIVTKLNRDSENSLKPVQLKDLAGLNRNLTALTYKERNHLPGMEEKRADIILAAGILMQRIMEIFGKHEYISLNKGLKDGLTIDCLNRLGYAVPNLDNPLQLKEKRLWEIGHKYSFDEKHARSVMIIACRLFDALKHPLEFSEEWKDYLKAAAILHDIGYHISYARHHKHSQYLIENSELIGFSENEIQIISNLARYHRKSIPDISHKKYRDLSIIDKAIVLKMGAVLRIADSLDRGHTGKFADFEAVLSKTTLKIRLKAGLEDFSLENDGIQSKAGLFEITFGRKVILETVHD